MYTGEFATGEVLRARRDVVVADTEPPTVQVEAESPLVVVRGTAFDLPEATVFDACEGVISEGIEVTDSVNPNVPGVYAIQYRASDSKGNNAMHQHPVLVVAAPDVSHVRVQVVATNEVDGTRSVALWAAVNPFGLETMVIAEYGATDEYGEMNEPVAIEGAYGSREVRLLVNGLEAEASYHARVVASNAAGSMAGADVEFSAVPQVIPGDTNGDGVVDQAELDVVLANYWPHSARIAMTNAVALGNGKFQFVLTNASGWDFTVEVSTNLMSWDALGTARPVYQFSDPAATNQPRRYYRLRWP
jgi:hypothetical protein